MQDAVRDVSFSFKAFLQGACLNIHSFRRKFNTILNKVIRYSFKDFGEQSNKNMPKILMKILKYLKRLV